MGMTVFEGLNCLLGIVTAVVVWMDELVSHGIVLDCQFEVGREFAIKDVVLGLYSFFLEAIHHVLVCSDHFTGGVILHYFHEDATAVNFDEHQHVFVAAGPFLGKTVGLVGEDFEEGLFVLNVIDASEDVMFF